MEAPQRPETRTDPTGIARPSSRLFANFNHRIPRTCGAVAAPYLVMATARSGTEGTWVDSRWCKGRTHARTAPNLFDLSVALAAGSAGAYAQIRRQAGDALIGVAVAVALEPPLAVLGITLQLGEWDLAVGAGLLFLANVAGIPAAAAATFIVCGFAKPHRSAQSFPLGRAVRGALALASLVMLPLVLASVWDGHKPTMHRRRGCPGRGGKSQHHHSCH